MTKRPRTLRGWAIGPDGVPIPRNFLVRNQTMLGAEVQLLDLLRGKRFDNFRVAIFYSDGQWTVEFETFDPPRTEIGQGKKFAEAWDALSKKVADAALTP